MCTPMSADVHLAGVRFLHPILLFPLEHGSGELSGLEGLSYPIGRGGCGCGCDKDVADNFTSG